LYCIKASTSLKSFANLIKDDAFLNRNAFLNYGQTFNISGPPSKITRKTIYNTPDFCPPLIFDPGPKTFLSTIQKHQGFPSKMTSEPC